MWHRFAVANSKLTRNGFCPARNVSQPCYWCENLGQADHLPDMVPELPPSYPLQRFSLFISLIFFFFRHFQKLLREFHCNLELHSKNQPTCLKIAKIINSFAFKMKVFWGHLMPFTRHCLYIYYQNCRTKPVFRAS